MCHMAPIAARLTLLLPFIHEKRGADPVARSTQ